jgi:glyoxylase-like metal-dependent hydrolase (beta-lactamase superfamily II)
VNFNPSKPLATSSDQLNSGKVKLPRRLRENLYSFPPNREILGGTSYFILNNAGNILVDCPPWRSPYPQFLQDHGGVRWLVLTHRGGISAEISALWNFLNCEVIIQEQEAYLLPTIPTTSFREEQAIADELTLLWTPGHSPGSSCLYDARDGGSLWTGRHLLPDSQGNPVPLRIEKTFHWPRQLQSVQKLCDRFSPETLNWIYPGANTGFLRGKAVIDHAYHRLAAIDIDQLKQASSPLSG